MAPFKDLTGQRFGALTVTGLSKKRLTHAGRPEMTWECKCDCGKTVDILGRRLKTHKYPNCGCIPKTKRQAGRNSVLTLCWGCQNAVPTETRGCSWSREFEPVEGWKATPTTVEKNSSFRVHKCPEFIPDERRPYAR